MEINVLEDNKGKFVFELKGASHTVCNILKKELWNDNNVKNVGYTIKHPLVGFPVFIVETDGDARKIIANACQKVKKVMEKLGSEAKKEVK